ncbi:MAG: 30S ribosomal protein S12 methylthiotransferase RimO [Clostridiales Family XIII bacterium]|nr:30S ribosomal protein S12 methylthiotransferase RimO [Clostridiales Family XIII bacterium]
MTKTKRSYDLSTIYTVYFETLGCPKNVCDSENAAGILEREGFRMAGAPESADVIVVNTCGFIDDAKRESIAAIFEMAEHKKDGKRLVVSGCLSQRYGDELASELPEVDRFIGVHDYGRLPAILNEILGQGAAPNATTTQAATAAQGATTQAATAAQGATAQGAAAQGATAQGAAARDAAGAVQDAPGTPPAAGNTARLPRKRLEPVYSAFVKAADGCDNRCSYCVIPQIRGPYRSRPMDEIVYECETLVDGGAKEIVLIAQDLTAYGSDLHGQPALHTLARRLCRIDGLRWLRLMYCYEDRITDGLIEAMAAEDKICGYIDMPIQHINSRILKSMRRHSTQESIWRTIEKLRRAMPDIAIRTTLIAGFPGESDSEFEELLDFVMQAKFDRLGAFAYSREEGTPAAEMEGQIDDETKQARLEALMLAQQKISLAKNRSMIGRTLEVLVEEENGDGSFFGRTRRDAPEIDNGVIFSAAAGAAASGTGFGADAVAGARPRVRPGDLVLVRINDAFDYDLAGELVSPLP